MTTSIIVDLMTIKNQRVVNIYIAPFICNDPYSIMLYKEQDEESEGFSRDSHEIWETKKGDSSQNTQLSELDKVGLNLVYPPCTGTSYEPKRDEETGIYYCGRKVMERHNIPDHDIVDGCQPGGPNCPACRTLGKPKGIGKKWQGWSSFLYYEDES